MTSKPRATELDAAPRRGRLQPVTAGERIELIDMLRGFALLGILAVNMRYFAHTFYLDLTWLEPFPSTLDRTVRALVEFFCRGKFYSLFSFLFGFGAAMQLMRAEQRGLSFAKFYARRLLVLLLFGIAHVVLLWDGDVLIQYATLGFLLIPVRKCRSRNLLIAAGPIILLSVLGTVVHLSESWSDFPFPDAPEQRAPEEFAPDAWLAELEAEEQAAADRPDYRERAREAYLTYRYGTYGETITQRIVDYVDGMFFALIYMDPHVLGMFLVGWYFARRGILHDPARHRTLLHQVLIIGLVLGLLGNLTMVWIDFTITPETNNPWTWVLHSVAWAVGAPALCLFYVVAFALFVRWPNRQSWLHPLSYVGRMALTNYLLQSLVCTLLFNGYGVGLYGEVGPAIGLVLTIVIFAAQIPLSALWLRHFRFGPAEWLWRTLSYGRMQPLRRSTSA